MIRRILFIATVCLAACSRSGKIPKDILPPEKMQAVYWDYMLADIFANDFVRRDSTKKPELENARLQAQLFKLHKISKEDFYRSYDYYLSNDQLMQDMLDTMLVRHTPIADTTAASPAPGAVNSGIKNRIDSIRRLPEFKSMDTSKTEK